MKKRLTALAFIATSLFSGASFAHGGGGYWFPGFVTGAVIGGAVVNSYRPYPYYPYAPYQPVYVQPPIYIQPAVTSYASPAPIAAQNTQESSNNWYYCQKTKSYYPYVNTCASGWKIVPSTPPDIGSR